MRIYTFNCPKCGGGLEVRGSETTVRCTYCSSSVIVPESLRLKEQAVSQEPTQQQPTRQPRWAIGLLVILGAIAVILLAQSVIGGLNGRASALSDAAGQLPIPIIQATNVPAGIPPSSVTQIALDVHEYPGLTVYWKRDLWDAEITETPAVEDFGLDAADYGELHFPYLTGNGLYLSGTSTAQILGDGSLMPGGTFIHFRDWETGLTFSFPNNSQISAFSFDFRASEELWQLWVNTTNIEIPDGRPGFIGVVIHEDYPAAFTLRGPEGAQGGLSVDNIAYVAIP